MKEEEAALNVEWTLDRVTVVKEPLVSSHINFLLLKGPLTDSNPMRPIQRWVQAITEATEVHYICLQNPFLKEPD